jgi:hypothetical protein
MERDREWQVSGPSGTLAQRVGDHVAAANELLQESRREVERLRARTEQAHRRVERTFRRVQKANLSARALRRFTAQTVDRFRKVKQRELAAHLAAAELHEQAAELQDRMGHPRRAAQARAQAERARRWHRLALEELFEYERRIAAATRTPKG